MANEFDIKKAILQGAGYVGLPFPNFKNFRFDYGDSSIGVSERTNKLGRPYFMDVKIDGVTLPNEPLVTITAKKTIVETVIVGSERRGTVKEFISAGDFNIKIQGVCITPGVKQYPQEQVQSIIDLAAKNEALDFSNELAELFGINRLVIKDYGLSDMKGMPYSQSYYLTCVSDEDFYAKLNQL